MTRYIYIIVVLKKQQSSQNKGTVPSDGPGEQPLNLKAAKIAIASFNDETINSQIPARLLLSEGPSKLGERSGISSNPIQAMLLTLSLKITTGTVADYCRAVNSSTSSLFNPKQGFA